MPPHPTTRCYPVRRPGFARENHRRGRSFEGDLLSKEKDDDLELFKEVQSREKENFFLQSTYDIDLALSAKFRYRSDLGLGFPFTVREEDVDLLNSEGEKNDYDWLLTPPETPLFPSLGETSSVNLTQNGRSQTRPRSMSRSYTMEKRYQSNRSSLSPCSRRPSSAPSSTLKRHDVAASQTLSGPNKLTSNIRRSSTLSSGRISTGSSSSVGSSGARGASPVRETRGNSASPKFRAWQSNFPGFSLDVPPNLRTSLADRPPSYVRGSSPASRYSIDSASRSSNISRRSMSPAASQSVGSSCGNRRDQCSPRSKGSVTSSAADDLDSLQSVPPRFSEGPYSKRLSTFPNNKSRTPKKLSRDVVSRSAPKGSFGTAARQMGYKSNQKMFRPLLSSVPNTSFYSGRPSASHISTISRNSSLTTSYASSDLGTTIAPDTEGSDPNHDDMASESGKLCSHEEIFALDKSEENMEPKAHDISHSTQLGCCDISDLPEGSGNFNRQCISEIDNSSSEVCSKCGNKFLFGESVEESPVKLCPDCRLNKCVLSGGHLLPSSFLTDINSLPLQSEKTFRTCCVESSERDISLPESAEDTDVNAASRHQREKQSHTHCSKPSKRTISPPRSAEFINANTFPLHYHEEQFRAQSPEQSARNVCLLQSEMIVDVNSPVQSQTCYTQPREKNSPLLQSMEATDVNSLPLHWNEKQSEACYVERIEPSEGIVQLPQSAEGMDVNLLPPHWREKQIQTYTVESSERNTARNFSLPESADKVDVNSLTQHQSEKHSVEISHRNTTRSFLLPEFGEVMYVNSLPQPWSEKQSQSCSVDISEREKCIEACPIAELLPDTSMEPTKVPASPSHDMVARTEIKTRTTFDDRIVFPDPETGLCEFTGSTLPENASHGTSGEVHSQSLTMEEVTEVVLYCNSVVHELAYKAASIAIDKEHPNLPEDSHKKLLIAGRSNDDKYARGRHGARRSFMPVKSRQVIETESRIPLTDTNGSNAAEVLTKDGNGDHVDQVVGYAKHPPKSGSKCNCIVM